MSTMQLLILFAAVSSSMAVLVTAINRRRQQSSLVRTLGLRREDLMAAGASARVADLLLQRDRIGAIKAYREETGTGLAEAKQYVDRLYPVA